MCEHIVRYSDRWQNTRRRPFLEGKIKGTALYRPFALKGRSIGGVIESGPGAAQTLNSIDFTMPLGTTSNSAYPSHLRSHSDKSALESRSASMLRLGIRAACDLSRGQWCRAEQQSGPCALGEPLPDRRRPVKARAARTRIAAAALTGRRRSGLLATKRVWLDASGSARMRLDPPNARDDDRHPVFAADRTPALAVVDSACSESGLSNALSARPAVVAHGNADGNFANLPAARRCSTICPRSLGRAVQRAMACKARCHRRRTIVPQVRPFPCLHAGRPRCVDRGEDHCALPVDLDPSHASEAQP